jgi:hypothetical protein
VLAVAITVQMEKQPDPEALAPATASVPSDRVDNFHSQAEKESKGQVEPSKSLADAGPPPARERRKAPPQETAPAVSPPPEVKPQAAEVARADRLEARQQQAPAVETQNAPAAAPVTPVPPQLDSQDRLTSGAAAGMFSQQQEMRRSREAPPAAAPPPEATTRPQANVQDRAVASIAPPTPERLLERIAELRKEGRHDEADKALAEFRQRYPEYRISEEMLKKVERPK